MPEVVNAEVKPAKINNKELVSLFNEKGGRVMHVRNRYRNDHGITVAYVRKGNRITFSTAVQHPADDFTKKIGTKTAIEHFNDGKVITLPFHHSNSAKWALLTLVGYEWGFHRD